MAEYVTCDECGNLFRAKPQEEIDVDGVLVFLACRSCGQRYPSAHISAKGVELRDEIREARKLGWGTTQSAAFRDLQERYKMEVTKL